MSLYEGRLVAIYRNQNTKSGNPRWIAEIVGSISGMTYIHKIKADTQVSLDVPNFLGKEVEFALNSDLEIISLGLTMRQLSRDYGKFENGGLGV